MGKYREIAKDGGGGRRFICRCETRSKKASGECDDDEVRCGCLVGRGCAAEDLPHFSPGSGSASIKQ